MRSIGDLSSLLLMQALREYRRRKPRARVRIKVAGVRLWMPGVTFRRFHHGR